MRHLSGHEEVAAAQSDGTPARRGTCAFLSSFGASYCERLTLAGCSKFWQQSASQPFVNISELTWASLSE